MGICHKSIKDEYQIKGGSCQWLSVSLFDNLFGASFFSFLNDPWNLFNQYIFNER